MPFMSMTTLTSALPASAVAAAATRRSMLRHDGQYLYWLEQRPEELGRGVIVRWSQSTGCEDITPSHLSVRSRVHEYGGGEFAVQRGMVVFTADPEQQVWCRDADGALTAITTASTPRHSIRYADFCWHPDGLWCYAVRERHTTQQVSNELVALSLRGQCVVLASGADFYAAPRVAPDGSRLVWLQWSNPQMPWDGTELWQAELAAPATLCESRKLVGSEQESVLQPGFGDDNCLYALTDRNGFWQLAEWHDDAWRFLHREPSDGTLAPWSLGVLSWAVTVAGEAWWLSHEQGFQQLWRQAPAQPAQRVSLPDRCLSTHLTAHQQQIFLLGAEVDRAERLFLYDTETQAVITIRAAAEWPSSVTPIPAVLRWLSAADRRIPFYFYLPEQNSGPAPLLVFCHSGPTGSASLVLQPAIQFWTSRGYAVADINYRGSDGYGRCWRQSLLGHWGDYDVADCRAVIEHLAQHEQVDASRIYLRGNSAGGLTALHLLAQTDAIRAAALRYPVVDLPALAAHSHKFEAHYLCRLVGVDDIALATLAPFSPTSQLHRIVTPLLIQQGDQDPVVPLTQALLLAEALIEHDVACELRLHSGEGHGFRQAETLTTALAAEFTFFERHR